MLYLFKLFIDWNDWFKLMVRLKIYFEMLIKDVYHFQLPYFFTV